MADNQSKYSAQYKVHTCFFFTKVQLLSDTLRLLFVWLTFTLTKVIF